MGNENRNSSVHGFRSENQNCCLIIFLVFSLAICGCASSKSNSASANGSSARQLKNSASGDDTAFESYAEASQALHQAMAQLGYDTSEGEHDIGTTQTFLATPLASNVDEFTVNVAWKQETPVGDFVDRKPDRSTFMIISRLDMTGPWIKCRGLLIEILSNAGAAPALTLMRSLREALSC